MAFHRNPSAIIAAHPSVSNARVTFTSSFSVPCTRSMRLFDSATRMLGTRRDDDAAQVVRRQLDLP